MTLSCTNDTKAGVLGAFWGKGLCEVKNKIKTVKVMFYVLKSGGNLLSRNTLRKLGVIDDEFPKVGKFELNLTMVKKVQCTQSVLTEQEVKQPVGQCDPDSDLPCHCPRHDLVDPPDKLPMPATPENRELLEEWIRKRYYSSAFNCCNTSDVNCGPPSVAISSGILKVVK